MKLDSLLAQVGKAAAQSIPPVESWNPPLSGDIDIVIQANGTWWHEGERIQRQELVNIFASILKQEEGEYFLVTPVEKWRIQVEDRPLHIHLIEAKEGEIHCLTTTGNPVVIGLEHPLQMSSLQGTELPEVKIRHNLWARFTRNAWYELLHCARETPEGAVYIESAGATFVLSNPD